ncbi:unnamed protein product [Cylindrotheca closterium]|uniref:Uncharacterized protein n=1 Tax=Cylindrotheca closterium TaxID=2856 RepID=A0AAD2JMW6_9STRA|nr:unnamed protein product [Cylindrotheca closterium]
MKNIMFIHALLVWGSGMAMASQQLRRGKQYLKNQKMQQFLRYVATEQEADDLLWEDIELQAAAMSMPTVAPTTRPPTFRPTRPPTRPPSLPATNPPTSLPATNPPTPFQTTTRLPNLELIPNDQFNEFGLSECQGDCDNDEDCNFGLICLQRNLGNKDVPGCFGDPDSIGNGSLDFCIQPQDITTLVIVGDEGFPTSVFPLDQCHGDCDSDTDCAQGLTCFQRTRDEAVPGCTGNGATGLDYCHNPTLSSRSGDDSPVVGTTNGTLPILDFIGDREMELYSLQECQGDCDFDSDCELGLVCFFRSFGDGGHVPGCSGNADGIASRNEDFCIKPPTENYLVILGDDDHSEAYPLPACAGDCDEDVDCRDNLVCVVRRNTTQIPGCEGIGEKGYDYCGEASQ